MARKKKSTELPVYDDQDDLSYLDNLDDDLLSTGSESPLSYDDDDIDIDEDYLGMDSSGKDEQQEVKKKGGGYGKLITIGVIVATILGGVIATQLGWVDNVIETDKPQSQQSENNDKQEEKPIEDDGVVVNEKVNETYSGSDNASARNGTGAILSFAYNMYTERDGQKAREYYNPDAKGYSSEMIQKEIDTTIPEGTTYNLEITPTQLGSKYEVVLTLNVPNFEKSVSYNLHIDTMERNGRYYIQTFTYDDPNNGGQ